MRQHPYVRDGEGPLQRQRRERWRLLLRPLPSWARRARSNERRGFSTAGTTRTLRAAPRQHPILRATCRQAALDLPISALRDLDQLVAPGRAADDIAHVTFDPQHGGSIAGCVVTQRR